MKSRARSGIGCGPEAAAMRLDDGTTNGQAHPDAIRLRRIKCIEHLVRLGAQADARITHRDQQVSTIRAVRLDGNFTCGTQPLYGLDAIEREVHQNLLQLPDRP